MHRGLKPPNTKTEAKACAQPVIGIDCAKKVGILDLIWDV